MRLTSRSSDAARLPKSRGAVLIALLALAAVAVGPGSEPARGQDPGAGQDLGVRIGLPAYVPGDPPGNERIMFKDSTISINTQCPVRGGRVDPNREPVYVNGKPVAFCCHPCPATFSYDAEKYLKPLEVTLSCPVRKGKNAILDSSLRAKVGKDIFFFSSAAAMKQFQKNPLRYVRTLTDPVTYARFRATPESPHVSFRGRDYYFESPTTLSAFQAQPERYFERTTGT